MGKPIMFGAGNLYGIDRIVAVPTPVKFGILQEVAVEIALTKKELHGQNVFADAVGVGVKPQPGWVNSAAASSGTSTTPSTTGYDLPSKLTDPQPLGAFSLMFSSLRLGAFA